MLAGCGGGSESPPEKTGGSAVVEAGPEHVHGLGVDPADGALYIATHTGLWRAAEGETESMRVGDLQHDLMGFTVVGPGRFLASGHPEVGHDLPPQMGLQSSTDGGRSWTTVSLAGQADLHVLRAAGRRIYGVDAGTGAFVTSADGGRRWEQRSPPAPVFDLAIAPGDDKQLVAATERGLFRSADSGRTWRPLRKDVAGLLAWPREDVLYLAEGDGTVSRSGDGGRRFERAGSIGAQPHALAARDDALYAALEGGKVVASGDGGASWRTRAEP